MILISNEDLDSYPDNTTSHFRNQLTLNEQLYGEWYACLEKINYEKSFNGEGYKDKFSYSPHPLIQRRGNLAEEWEQKTRDQPLIPPAPFFLIELIFPNHSHSACAWKVDLAWDAPVWNTPHLTDELSELARWLNDELHWHECDEEGDDLVGDEERRVRSHPTNFSVVHTEETADSFFIFLINHPELRFTQVDDQVRLILADDTNDYQRWTWEDGGLVGGRLLRNVGSGKYTGSKSALGQARPIQMMSLNPNEGYIWQWKKENNNLILHLADNVSTNPRHSVIVAGGGQPRVGVRILVWHERNDNPLDFQYYNPAWEAAQHEAWNRDVRPVQFVVKDDKLAIEWKEGAKNREWEVWNMNGTDSTQSVPSGVECTFHFIDPQIIPDTFIYFDYVREHVDLLIDRLGLFDLDRALLQSDGDFAFFDGERKVMEKADGNARSELITSLRVELPGLLENINVGDDKAPLLSLFPVDTKAEMGDYVEYVPFIREWRKVVSTNISTVKAEVRAAIRGGYVHFPNGSKPVTIYLTLCPGDKLSSRESRPAEETTLILRSDAFPQHFPNNTPFHFRSLVSPPLTLTNYGRGWEVSLSQATFTRPT